MVGETVEFVFSVGDDGRPRAVNVTRPGGAYIKGMRCFGGACYSCGEVGHMAMDCKSNGVCARLGPCYSCGEMGHLARECPATRFEPSISTSNLLNPSKLGSISPLLPPMAMALNLVKGDIPTQLDRLPESMDSDEKEEVALNEKDKEFPMGVDERNWAELPGDILTVIFKKIAPIRIIRSAQLVCRPWRLISHEPELWRCIDMRMKDEHIDMTHSEFMTMVAVDRSEGCVEELYVEHFGSDELLGYIADRATKLRCLHLRSVFHMSDMALVQALRRFLLLEDLEISLGSFSDKVIESVGQACPQLKSFRLNVHSYKFQDDTVALAIAKHMQQLRCLQLFGNTLTNIGLFAILDNCPNLQCLDIRRCVNVLLDETLKKKCAGIKDLRLPNDSTADCEFDAIMEELYNVNFDGYYFYNDSESGFEDDDYFYYD